MFTPKITDAMNEAMCKPYCEEEIGNALFQIGPPGSILPKKLGLPEGRHGAYSLGLFYSGCMLNGVNNTSIVLIPRGPNPKH